MTEMQQPRTQSLSWRSPAQSTAAADMPTVTADDSDGRIHPPQRPGHCNRLGSLHLVFPTSRQSTRRGSACMREAPGCLPVSGHELPALLRFNTLRLAVIEIP